MEYFKGRDGQIQADLARRLGIVLKQYHTEILSSEKYEVSLCLSILQTLLTNCVELLNDLITIDKQNNPLYEFPIDPKNWGFDESNIILNTFNEPKLTVEQVIRHIRNALSHPTKVYLSSKKKTTGYTTLGGTASIEKIKFIDSPDLHGGGKSREYRSKPQAKQKMRSQGNFPPDVLVHQMGNTKFAFIQNGKPFHRIFEIDLTPGTLVILTYSLANYLSHPLFKSWDGKTFRIETIAA